jgi:hypothetical protein
MRFEQIGAAALVFVVNLRREWNGQRGTGGSIEPDEAEVADRGPSHESARGIVRTHRFGLEGALHPADQALEEFYLRPGSFRLLNRERNGLQLAPSHAA